MPNEHHEVPVVLWDKRVRHFLALLQRVIEGDPCRLFTLTPGGVMGVMVNHALKEKSPDYRALKDFLLDIPAADDTALVTGHSHYIFYDQLNYLCETAKAYQDRQEKLQ